MTKRTTLETLSADIRNALFVVKDATKAEQLIGKATILVKTVRTKHEQGMWATVIEGWRMELARV